MINIVSIGLTTILPILMMVIISGIFSIVYYYYVKLYKNDIKSGQVDIEIIDEYIYNNLPHVKKRKKRIKTINSFVFYGFLIVMTPVFIFAISNKLSGNVSSFGKKGLVAVASGSMSLRNSKNDYLIEYDLTNQFNTFDIIMIEKVDSDSDLALHDVIAFVSDDGVLTIHRIRKIETREDGVVEYTTRGDSNNEDDTTKSTLANIKGKYVDYRIPFLGAFILFFQSLMGIVTIIILVCCIILFDKESKKIGIEKEHRIKKFDEVKILDLINNSDNLYTVKIYYQGILYRFNEKGFIDKEKILREDKYFEASQEMLIKVFEEEGKEPLVKNYLISK